MDSVLGCDSGPRFKLGLCSPAPLQASLAAPGPFHLFFFNLFIYFLLFLNFFFPIISLEFALLIYGKYDHINFLFFIF